MPAAFHAKTIVSVWGVVGGLIDVVDVFSKVGTLLLLLLLLLSRRIGKAAVGPDMHVIIKCFATRDTPTYITSNFGTDPLPWWNII